MNKERNRLEIWIYMYPSPVCESVNFISTSKLFSFFLRVLIIFFYSCLFVNEVSLGDFPFTTRLQRQHTEYTICILYAVSGFLFSFFYFLCFYLIFVFSVICFFLFSVFCFLIFVFSVICFFCFLFPVFYFLFSDYNLFSCLGFHLNYNNLQ